MENMTKRKHKTPEVSLHIGSLQEWTSHHTKHSSKETNFWNSVWDLHYKCPHSIFRLLSPSLTCYLELKPSQGQTEPSLPLDCTHLGCTWGKRSQRNVMPRSAERQAKEREKPGVSQTAPGSRRAGGSSAAPAPLRACGMRERDGGGNAVSAAL